LHLVDLDGAKEGRPINGDSVRAIVQAAGIPCQLGGGLRTEADIREVLGWGVSRVIIGTKALTSPNWLDEMTAKFPQRIVLGIDAKNGLVATHGWLDVSTTSAVELAKRFEPLPLAGLVYTDIARDGMMQGVNAAAMTEMVHATKLPVIASGGVTMIADIRLLRAIPVAGVIVGRALYEGTVDLREITVAAS
jgi:phosphoribosylformimino-5-aminoimidazole carboxamide ribotide isomerase